MASPCRRLLPLLLAVLLLGAAACGQRPGRPWGPDAGEATPPDSPPAVEVGEPTATGSEEEANRPLAPAGATRDKDSPYYRPKPVPDRFAASAAGLEDAPWNRPADGPLSLELPARTTTRTRAPGGEPGAVTPPPDEPTEVTPPGDEPGEVAPPPDEPAQAPTEEPAVSAPVSDPGGALLDADARLERARARKQKAYEEYTRLVTTDAEGDVEAAREEYRQAIEEVEALERAR